MEFQKTDIPDVVLIRPKVFGDSRGFFFESWEEKKFSTAGINDKFVQDNQSRSTRHVLRGLHYQIRQPQGKLVRVVSGSVFDVAVDLRRSSSTFGRWVGVELSAENRHILWIPPGFAHGFLVLSSFADFSYRCTNFWAPSHERTVLWNDLDLDITWPLPKDADPILSEKDAAGLRFREAEHFL